MKDAFGVERSDVSKKWSDKDTNTALAAGGLASTVVGAHQGVRGANQILEGRSTRFIDDARKLKLSGKKGLVRGGALIAGGTAAAYASGKRTKKS